MAQQNSNEKFGRDTEMPEPSPFRKPEQPSWKELVEDFKAGRNPKRRDEEA
jgi:hypothetical protein